MLDNSISKLHSIRPLAFLTMVSMVFAVHSAAAQTEQVTQTEQVEQSQRFVSDQLEITLRRGAGTRYGITRMLKSGTPLQVLEDNGKGYARVTAPDGVSGWVLTRFLQDEPVARERIAENEQRMQEMHQQGAAVQEQLNGLQQLQSDLSRARAEKERLQAELQQIKIVAADALAISEQNQVLQQELEESSATQQGLIEKNKRLGKETEQRWFMIGGGVILLGMLIGLIVPKIRWKRRRRSMGGGINIDF